MMSRRLPSSATTRRMSSISLSMPSPRRWTRASTARASSSRPRSISQRGLCGIRIIPTASATPGAAPRPSIHRQLPATPLNRKPPSAATTASTNRNGLASLRAPWMNPLSANLRSIQARPPAAAGSQCRPWLPYPRLLEADPARRRRADMPALGNPQELSGAAWISARHSGGRRAGAGRARLRTGRSRAPAGRRSGAAGTATVQASLLLPFLLAGVPSAKARRCRCQGLEQRCRGRDPQRSGHTLCRNTIYRATSSAAPQARPEVRPGTRAAGEAAMGPAARSWPITRLATSESSRL
jgi:hypothetical protein